MIVDDMSLLLQVAAQCEGITLSPEVAQRIVHKIRHDKRKDDCPLCGGRGWVPPPPKGWDR